jgi:putative transposase
MSTRYKIKDQSKLHFVTSTVINWIDVFTRNQYKDIILDSLRYCQKNKGLEVYAWVLMTNHLHMIIGTHGGNLENIMRDFKSFTSRSIKEEILASKIESRKDWMLKMMKQEGISNTANNEWQFWQNANHPIELSTNNMIDQRLNYIHLNPVKAGFVYKPEDWIYSSAIDYCGGKGLLDIILIN